MNQESTGSAAFVRCHVMALLWIAISLVSCVATESGIPSTNSQEEDIALLWNNLPKGVYEKEEHISYESMGISVDIQRRKFPDGEIIHISELNRKLIVTFNDGQVIDLNHAPHSSYFSPQLLRDEERLYILTYLPSETRSGNKFSVEYLPVIHIMNAEGLINSIHSQPITATALLGNYDMAIEKMELIHGVKKGDVYLAKMIYKTHSPAHSYDRKSVRCVELYRIQSHGLVPIQN